MTAPDPSTGPAPPASRGAYPAVPVPTTDRPGPWPGVVIVHDLFGLGDDMREQADWLAAAGYLVSVPDLFEGRRPLGCIRSARPEHGVARLLCQARPEQRMKNRLAAATILFRCGPSQRSGRA